MRTHILRSSLPLVVSTSVALISAPSLVAQAPGLPVLQGAFPGRGFAVAANVGRASGQPAVLGAAGFGARSGSLHFDLGAGVLTGGRDGYRSGQFMYGGRLAVRAVQFFDERVAVTPFAGYGSTRAKLTRAARADSGTTVQFEETPVGAAVGGRIAVGGRAVALSVAPFYAWYRQSGAVATDTRGRLRATVSAEVALTPRIGVGLGIETGQTSDSVRPGPQGSLIALSASFAVGRR